MTLDDIITSYIAQKEQAAMKYGADREQARIIRLLKDFPELIELIKGQK